VAHPACVPSHRSQRLSSEELEPVRHRHANPNKNRVIAKATQLDCLAIQFKTFSSEIRTAKADGSVDSIHHCASGGKLDGDRVKRWLCNAPELDVSAHR